MITLSFPGMDNAQNSQFDLQRTKLEDELHSMDNELKSGGDSAASIYKEEKGMGGVESQLEGMVHNVEQDEDQNNLRGVNSGGPH